MKHRWREYESGATCRVCGAVRRQAARTNERVCGYETDIYGDRYPIVEIDSHPIEIVTLGGVEVSSTKCRGVGR